jgi:hypothetical protein
MYGSLVFFYQKWSKTRRCFIATAFHLCFRIFCQEGPGKPGGTEIKWDYQLLAYADDVNLLGDSIP